MSHFSVLVVGEDVDEALAPFDENLETPRVMRGEVDEEEKIRFLNYYLNRDKPESEQLSEDEIAEKLEEEGLFEYHYAEHGNSWNGEAWEKNSRGVWVEYSTYNPNSKWDWYEIGGRYAGRLLLKKDVPQTSRHKVPNPSLLFSNEAKAKIISDDRRVDSAKVSEIDWEQMDAKRLKANNKNYDEFETKMADPEQREKMHPYFEYGIKPIKITPEEFEANMDNPMYYWNDRTESHFRYQTREEYVGMGKFATFAMLVDGEWYEQGDMGWFGMVSDEKENGDWEEEFQNKLKSFHPDTIVTVVDCHI